MDVTLTQDELLVIAMEEAAELIKEAAKCYRSGLAYVPFQDAPKSGLASLTTAPSNIERLSAELGDLLGVLDCLPIDRSIMQRYRSTKMQRMIDAKRKYGR